MVVALAVVAVVSAAVVLVAIAVVAVVVVALAVVAVVSAVAVAVTRYHSINPSAWSDGHCPHAARSHSFVYISTS